MNIKTHMLSFKETKKERGGDKSESGNRRSEKGETGEKVHAFEVPVLPSCSLNRVISPRWHLIWIKMIIITSTN